MATGVHAAAGSDLAKHMVEVSEFGLLDTILFEPDNPDKIYHGRVYKLEPEDCKVLAEQVGFAANFEHPAVRTANLDIFDGQGFVVWEIDRNTKPQDVVVRYSRDRWELGEVIGNVGEKLRPAIRTEYRAKTLAEEMVSAVCQQIKVAADALDKFFVRLNFKDRTYSLITEKEHLLLLPGGWHYSFLVPKPVEEPEVTESDAAGDSTVAEAEQPSETAAVQPGAGPQPAAPEPPKVVPRTLAPTPPTPSNMNTQQSGTPKMDTQLKYATYSRSETDSLLKQHIEGVSSQLGSKISTLQRAVQEANAEQQKGFTRTQEEANRKFEQSTIRLEKATQEFSAGVTGELDTFKKALTKELEQFRNQVNKAVLPVAKALEEKPEKLSKPAKEQKGQPVVVAPARDPVMLGLLVALLAAVVITAGMSISKLSEIDDLKAKVSELSTKLDKSSSSP